MTIKTKLSFKDACFQWASNIYLFEEVPDEYFEMSEEDQHNHLEQYAWDLLNIILVINYQT